MAGPKLHVENWQQTNHEKIFLLSQGGRSNVKVIGIPQWEFKKSSNLPIWHLKKKKNHSFTISFTMRKTDKGWGSHM